MNNLLRVVIIDDSQNDAELVLYEVSKNYKVEHVIINNEYDLRQALSEKDWDVILCDFSMPNFDPYKVLNVLDGYDIDIPLIVISGTIGEDNAIKLLKAGCSDCITKGNLTRLPGVIDREIKEARVRKENKLLNKNLNYERDRARTYFDTANIMFLAINKDETVEAINKEGCKILGLDEKSIVGKNWFDNFVPQNKISEIKSNFNRVINGELEEFEIFENSIILAKGEERIISWHNALLKDNQGNITGILSAGNDVTDSIQTEQELIASEAKYSSYVENAPDGVFVSNSKGQYIEVNRAAELVTGYSRQELLNMTIGDVLIEESMQVGMAHFKRLLKYGFSNGAMQFKHKDGSIHWWEVNAVKLTDDQFLGFVKDITKEKNNEHKLIESEARHKAMVAGISDVIGIIDNNGMIIYKSPNIERLFGWKPAELVGKSFSTTVHPIDLPRLTPVYERILSEDNYSETIEFKYRCKDGTYKMVELTATNHLKDNYIQGILINYKDITERQIAKEAIAEEKERLAVTLRSIGDGVITTDIGGNVLIMNRVAEELTGWNNSEAYGKSINKVFNIVNEITREPFETQAEKVLHNGYNSKQEGQAILVSKSGDEKVVADSCALINNNKSEVIGVVIVFRDITETQKLLENMQRIDKLDSLGVLAGGIAHDFNNLLGGIFGYIELAKTSCNKNEEANNYLDKALTVFERARDLTQQLLTFSKGGVPKRETGQLGKFIEESALFVLSGTNISPQFDIKKDLWLCDFDGNQIGQVIDNMLINATQAMPQGGQVEISARNRVIEDGEKTSLEPGRYIEIVIKDNGEGINKEVLKSIFDPFFSTKSKGNGLGLATCYSIVQKHDGSIEVDSEVGKGTTFYIYLPASVGNELINKQVVVDEHHGEGIILVMDDEDFIREILSEMLISMGYTVIQAVSGEDMIKISEGLREEGKHIKCAIVDLTIPGGMGGKEALVKLNTIFPDMPVFASSGFSKDPAMARPEDFGFTDSILKPIRVKDLALILEKHKDSMI